MKKFISFFPIWTLSIAVILAVLYLTLFPDPLPDNDMQLFPGADKVVHAIMMLGVSGCVALDYMRSRCGREHKNPPKRILLAIMALTILFGGFIELLQSWMGLGRSEDIYDFIADSAGAFLAFIIELLWWSRLRRHLLE